MQPKCPSMDEWIKDMYIYLYILYIRKNKKVNSKINSLHYMIKKRHQSSESHQQSYIYMLEADSLKNNDVSVYVMKWDKITANTPQRK